VHGDALDLLRIVQAEVDPGPAGVGRPVDAVAERCAVARVPLAAAEPEDVVIRRRDLERADRVDGLIREQRLEGGAAVGRLEDAAVGAGRIEDLRVARETGDGGDPAARVGRPDRAPAQAGEGRLARRGSGAERRSGGRHGTRRLRRDRNGHRGKRRGQRDEAGSDVHGPLPVPAAFRARGGPGTSGRRGRA
jgi:hypothetical protein